jgi:hypothetical protein
MRRILNLLAGLSLLSVVGCVHNTCDCCGDICGSCCGGGGVYTAPGGAPVVQPGGENIKKMPAPAPAPAPAAPAVSN